MHTMSLVRRSALALSLIAGAALAQPGTAPKPTTPPPTPTPTTPSKPATPAIPTTPAKPAQPEKQPEKPKSDEKLPTGKEVLAKYIEATGGKAAYEKVKTRVSEGTLEIKPMGIKGTIKMYQQAPAMMALNISLDQMGEISQGNNGKHAWESNPMMGARLLSGDELDESNRQAMIAAELDPDAMYKSVECTGSEMIGEIDCYKVDMETKGGSKRTAFYGKKDGLMHRLSMTVKSAMGDAKADSTMEDYKEVDGIKVAHKATMSIDFGQKIEQVMTFTAIKHNVEIEAAKFNPPKEVQDLIDSESKKNEKKDGDKPADKPAEKPAAPTAPAAPAAPATPGPKSPK